MATKTYTTIATLINTLDCIPILPFRSLTAHSVSVILFSVVLVGLSSVLRERFRAAAAGYDAQ